MPSGRTHDAITFILAAPALAVSYAATGSVPFAGVFTAAFLFGGLMFGPDLDTVSKQYSRWRFFRFLWFPYRSFFKHRSRWSHGLIFGTFLRVVYFAGAVTIAALLAAFALAAYFGTSSPEPIGFVEIWGSLGRLTRENLGAGILPATFIGMWAGAASHTATDIAGSYIKTGRVGEFL